MSLATLNPFDQWVDDPAKCGAEVAATPAVLVAVALDSKAADGGACVTTRALPSCPRLTRPDATISSGDSSPCNPVFGRELWSHFALESAWDGQRPGRVVSEEKPPRSRTS